MGRDLEVQAWFLCFISKLVKKVMTVLLGHTCVINYAYQVPSYFINWISSLCTFMLKESWRSFLHAHFLGLVVSFYQKLFYLLLLFFYFCFDDKGKWLGSRQIRCNWATKGANSGDDKQSSDSRSVVELTSGTSGISLNDIWLRFSALLFFLYLPI